MSLTTDLRKCAVCGAVLPADAPQGLCPRCVVQVGLSPTAGMTASTPRGPGMRPPTPQDLAALFPQLDIIELLGHGGMGAVYKARQPGLDRFVALKVLPPISESPPFIERFTREARALARLSHPNIVGVYDFGQTQGLCYFVMEYVDGMNLRQLIQSGGVQPEQALSIVPRICEALQYAHDEGVVHRDIKPENILLDKKGRVKIADFGLAKILAADGGGPAAHLTQESHVMGTPHYMAPEQVERPLSVDHRADIYSLGVVFYEMLTGELPLGRFAPPSHKVRLDVRLDEVVLRALEKEPERRYQKASDVRTQVESIQAHASPGVVGAAFSSLLCANAFSGAAWRLGYEYRSKRTVAGLPLVHIATGIDPVTGRKRIARGIIAVGDIAIGVVAVGGASLGAISVGGIALGLVSFGGLALALLLALGGCAVGAVALGGAAIGFVGVGGGAVGYYALGGGAAGVHVVDGKATSAQRAAVLRLIAAYWPLMAAGFAACFALAAAMGLAVVHVVHALRKVGRRDQLPAGREQVIAGVVKAVLLTVYVVGLTMFFTYRVNDVDGGTRRQVGSPTPWLVAEKGAGGAKWVVRVNSYAWPIVAAALLAYLAYWRIRKAEGSARWFDSPDAHSLLWLVLIGASTVGTLPWVY